MSGQAPKPEQEDPQAPRHTGNPGNNAPSSRAPRQAAAEPQRGAGHNQVADDQTYGELRLESRVVMRQSIALNLESFRPASADFSARPKRAYPPLQPEAVPFISVIIPNYNGHQHLPTVLDALQRQSLRDFELIVADDGSHDGSVAYVEARAQQGDGPPLRLLVNRQPVGFAANCNQAAAAARGRILVLLNSDTEPEPGWLAALAQAVCAHPEAAVVASKILLFANRSLLHAAGDELGPDGIPRNRGVWQPDRGQYDQATRVFSGCGAGAAYRKDVWNALGGFDEAFWMYLEDVDYAFRAHLLGWETIYAPAARLYHQMGGSGGDTLSSFYVGRNTIWNLVKNMPDRLLWRLLPRILFAQLAIGLDALRNVRGEAARSRLRGQLVGLLGIPGQWRKRQLIQARRQVPDDAIAALLQN